MWFSAWRQDHAIDQHAGNLHLARVEHAVSANALDLHDDEAVGVLRRHRQREIVERQCLALHGDVAAQVGGGATEQRHRDGEGFVEQPFLVVDLHHAHQVVGSAVVDLATLLARIDKRAQPHLGQRAGPVSGDVAKQLAQVFRAAGCMPRCVLPPPSPRVWARVPSARRPRALPVHPGRGDSTRDPCRRRVRQRIAGSDRAATPSP